MRIARVKGKSKIIESDKDITYKDWYSQFVEGKEGNLKVS